MTFLFSSIYVFRLLSFISCGELSAEDLKSFQTSRGLSVTEQLNEQFKVLVESYNNHRSQLNIIFDILGTPSEEDLAHLDKRTADILRSLPPKEGLVRLSDVISSISRSSICDRVSM